MPQPCNLDGISMNIQAENSARYFPVQSEREQTLNEQAGYKSEFASTKFMLALR